MGAAFKLRNGSLLVTTEAPGGIYNSDQLKKIAALADEDSAIIKVTEDQRLALFMSEDKAYEIIEELKTIGLGVRHYQDGLHQPTTCIGELCPDYQQDALGSALKITEEMSRLKTDNPLKIGINGCAQCCVPCHTLDISIVGDEQGYRISMGGKNSQIPEMATFMAEGVPEAELPGLVHNIVQLYKDSAEDGESLQDVMDRVGVSRFAEVLAPYSQDAAGGDDLFGESSNFADESSQSEDTEAAPLEGMSDAETLPENGEGTEIADDARTQQVEGAELADGLENSEEVQIQEDVETPGEDDSETLEEVEEEALAEIEEVDDFDQGIEDKLVEENNADEEAIDKFIDEDLDSDISEGDELNIEEDVEEDISTGQSDGLVEVEDDDFSDIEEDGLQDLDEEETLVAAAKPSGQDPELQDLEALDDDDDLDFSDFDAENEELEIGDAELDQLSDTGLETAVAEESSSSDLEDEVLIDDEMSEGLAAQSASEEASQSESDLSEISDEDLSDFDEMDEEHELESADHMELPDEQHLADSSDVEIEEANAEEADELEKRINEDILDSQVVQEPDSNEEDRNAILREVEADSSPHQANVASVKDYQHEKNHNSQFEFEGFDVKDNGDFVIAFTSGAQLQFNYDLIKDAPRKIKLGSQVICIGLDSSMIFVELAGGLRMNIPLNAA